MSVNENIILLSLAAGLSTTLGYLIIFLPSKKIDSILNFSLLLCSSVMITVSLTELLMQATKNAEIALDGIYPYLFILFVVAATTTSLFLMFKGDQNQNYQRIGFISFIAIILHNFPEGIVTYMSGRIDYNMGLQIALAIALHNIPEGIAIALPIYKSSKSYKKAFFYTFTAGLSEPLGALLAMNFIKSPITPLALAIIFALCASVMLYLAFKELLPETYGKKPKTVLTPVILGIFIIYLTGYIFG